MKISGLLLTAILFVATATAQVPSSVQQRADSVVAEGKRLYRSEMASWHGTDLFVERGGDQDKLRGYFSYASGTETRCILVSGDEKPVAICRVTFDSLSRKKSAVIEMEERQLTEEEMNLLALRNAAITAMEQDTFYKMYKNTTPNVIPMIGNGEKRVYVITGTSMSGVFLFGNDYLLHFDQDNKLTSVEKFHRSLIEMPYSTPDGGTAFSGAHSHTTFSSDIITATDICTLMLYQHVANLKKYRVLSRNYMSIWDCQTNSLRVMTRAEYDASGDND